MTKRSNRLNVKIRFWPRNGIYIRTTKRIYSYAKDTLGFRNLDWETDTNITGIVQLNWTTDTDLVRR